mmetsp:Transcript_44503/g.141695  ORF Transcript_44503/g.141695 Transcript_44503/m.141695 type:complete len:143 (-) Transcript_44503:57-485(-)
MGRKSVLRRSKEPKGAQAKGRGEGTGKSSPLGKEAFAMFSHLAPLLEGKSQVEVSMVLEGLEKLLSSGQVSQILDRRSTAVRLLHAYVHLPQPRGREGSLPEVVPHAAGEAQEVEHPEPDPHPHQSVPQEVQGHQEARRGDR